MHSVFITSYWVADGLTSRIDNSGYLQRRASALHIHLEVDFCENWIVNLL
jgi:hypothetical protein